MHYNTFPPIKQDSEAFKRQVEAAVPGVVCYSLIPGQEQTFGA